MSIPACTLKVYEKTRIDRVIEAFAAKDHPTLADLNAVRVQVDIQCQIDAYRFDALSMSAQELETEKHCSTRLAENMEGANDPRPAPAEYCHCHAMVSGGHPESAMVRAVLAWCLMRIDDPRNGCWLPRNTKARVHMPDWLKNAVPHSRIHRKSYYRWLGDLINPMPIKSADDLVRTLKMVRMRLQSGSIPRHIIVEMGL
ncbi:AHH domain-containing protein [Microbulbifer sp.]|uniref:AHH domain-containing protein n=1 Tax=Microbulbifer sp. TaxID=1908541 RepID=UPI003F398E8B